MNLKSKLMFICVKLNPFNEAIVLVVNYSFRFFALGCKICMIQTPSWDSPPNIKVFEIEIVSKEIVNKKIVNMHKMAISNM